MINYTNNHNSQKDLNNTNTTASNNIDTMTAELPSVNSTTSLSDNVALRNYYDKLLFKNSSGKSLSDLPSKLLSSSAQLRNSRITNEIVSKLKIHGDTQNDPKSDKIPSGDNEHLDAAADSSGHSIDFINGFKSFNLEGNDSHTFNSQSASNRLSFSAFEMAASNSEPFNYHGNFTVDPHNSNYNHSNVLGQSTPSISQNSTRNDPKNQALFSFGLEDHTNDRSFANQNHISHSSLYFPGQYNNGHTNNLSPTDIPTPIHSSGNQYTDFQNQHQHQNQQQQQQSQQYIETARRSSYISDTLIHRNAQGVNTMGILRESIFNNGSNTIVQERNYSVSGASSNMYPPSTAPTVPNMSHNLYPQYRRNTQPYVSSTAPSTAASIQTYNYLQYSQQLGGNNVQGFPENSLQSDELNLDSGLTISPDQQIKASDDLKKLYIECGASYFSSSIVYDFADYIKSMIRSKPSDTDKSEKNPALSFLEFLKSCNTNYINRRDSYLGNDKNRIKANDQRIDSSQESSNLKSSRKNSTVNSPICTSYKPLVLVTLKNGKLELLSIPENANLLMQRGDMIIIDGDRGKDLALVVEPVVDLELALFIYFLKKKIHFDSLITSKSQHYPNKDFINALIECTKGQGDKLNSKLYDVVELTQLVVPSKQVIRFATPWEVTTNLHNKFQDELKALHVAKTKLNALNNNMSSKNSANSEDGSQESAGTNSNSNRSALNITILNAEFQFDRKKLTFYYICEERNDFRELIKELFKFYKTRIWLCAIPNNLDIYSKYYDANKKELQMYQLMVKNYTGDDILDTNVNASNNSNGYIMAPPLNKIELDDFQIGVYKELVKELFH
ncbi:hypothetical protein Kpol_2000p89 [Vanderwaltozyma polyspora DSM 70294]|uniref:PSP1 C-terminal domain-containing protein n=1 Tax=Vanderwaltozyma polyspora (strain ATCC 22028 / DSM 70294 / BCRC 21397 / CBS 2163 / NBRC 10782 / NRRL Y-8283 / UCD 57-17) TaxID=436907 RepID=A7TF96_VANPO|nr:uncharacterized protein Kpol_2000p89 [Vanderwaltozyma polyspora DSM 70294]EDO19121.1 hypothetical protein Kpol_2000p89 [Vanderwaltozyma polyspora DSM 70294]